MNDVFDAVKSFLSGQITMDDFFESSAVVWVDWREDDSDLIGYFNDLMKEPIEVQMIDNANPYSDDIILKKGYKVCQIPYQEVMDRDTTIKYFNDCIKPEYEIRWLVESLGSDTLGFVLLPSYEWQSLAEEFGHTKVENAFLPITLESKMFDLDVNDVFDLIELRSKNESLDFATLLEWVKLGSEERALSEQKEDGEIDLKTYLEAQKRIKALKDDFIAKHPDVIF